MELSSLAEKFDLANVARVDNYRLHTIFKFLSYRYKQN